MDLKKNVAENKNKEHKLQSQCLYLQQELREQRSTIENYERLLQELNQENELMAASTKVFLELKDILKTGKKINLH